MNIIPFELKSTQNLTFNDLVEGDLFQWSENSYKDIVYMKVRIGWKFDPDEYGFIYMPGSDSAVFHTPLSGENKPVIRLKHSLHIEGIE